MVSASNQELLVAVITATILFFLFACFTILYFLTFRRKQKMHRMALEQSRKEFERQLMQSQIEVQENAYRHIAKELHDNVGQLLCTVKMLIGITELRVNNAPPSLQTASETLSKAIQEIRGLSRSLDKEWLQQFNFLDNLQAEINRINSSQAIKATITGDMYIDMKPEGQIILFRVIQEAIQNAVRHAQPSYIQVHIESGDILEVKVTNDGKPLPAGFQGMGTNNMRQRVLLFDGSVKWASDDNKTVVAISIPVKMQHDS